MASYDYRVLPGAPHYPNSWPSSPKKGIWADVLGPLVVNEILDCLMLAFC